MSVTSKIVYVTTDDINRLTILVLCYIDREFVTSAKKIANVNEFSKIKKIRKNSYKNTLNARVGVAFQQQLKNLMRFTVSC